LEINYAKNSNRILLLYLPFNREKEIRATADQNKKKGLLNQTKLLIDYNIAYQNSGKKKNEQKN
jgi:hypothetical protein